MDSNTGVEIDTPLPYRSAAWLHPPTVRIAAVGSWRLGFGLRHFIPLPPGRHDIEIRCGLGCARATVEIHDGRVTGLDYRIPWTLFGRGRVRQEPRVSSFAPLPVQLPPAGRGTTLLPEAFTQALPPPPWMLIGEWPEGDVRFARDMRLLQASPKLNAMIAAALLFAGFTGLLVLGIALGLRDFPDGVARLALLGCFAGGCALIAWSYRRVFRLPTARKRLLLSALAVAIVIQMSVITSGWKPPPSAAALAAQAEQSAREDLARIRKAAREELAGGDPRLAEVLLYVAVREHPEALEARLELAELYASQQRLSDALEQLEQAAALDAAATRTHADREGFAALRDDPRLHAILSR